MAKVQTKGLERAKEIYQHRDQRAKELKAEGKKIIGYFCAYPPLEIMTSLDVVPYRILGNMEKAIVQADAYLPTIVCPFIRSCFDLGLTGEYDFLDGAVGVHVCDTCEKVAHLWRFYLNPLFSQFIDIPHTVHKASLEFFKEELITFGKELEKFTGKKITDERLKKEITLHNEQRRLVKELYNLKKPDPPLLSGAETLQVMMALMSIPVLEGNELLKEVIEAVKQRRTGPKKQPARLLIWGTPVDNIAMIEMVEESGANVVMDDTCVGSRFYWPEVDVKKDPMDGLAERYLNGLKCPRTFRETGENYKKDLENRFGYIGDYAKEWKVNGVIMQSVKYCDTHGYEVPGLKDYLEAQGLPALFIEHEYTRVALAPLRTRVQAFLELIGG